jgi:hypothetical protein
MYNDSQTTNYEPHSNWTKRGLLLDLIRTTKIESNETTGEKGYNENT